MVEHKSVPAEPLDQPVSDRRRWERTSLAAERVRVQLRLPHGAQLEGRLLDLSPGGMRVRLDDPEAEDALCRARVAHVTVRSSKALIFEVDASVVHVSTLGTGDVSAGLQIVHEREQVERPRNLSDRRVYDRIDCDLPGTVLDSSGQAASVVPVILSDISEMGCRISGIPPTNPPRLGALIELCIHPPAGTAVRVAARIVALHDQRECGVRFEGTLNPELSAMIAAVRYPDLVMATPPDAPGMWEVLSAAGYLRERDPDRYLELRDDVVTCWARLSAPEADSLNRSVISTDARGMAQSITQVTRFYPSTWLGHHLAAAGDKCFRRRVVPQHHGHVHDTVEAIGADYFLVYYNALHKGQTSLYSTLRDRFPEAEMALNDLVCFDVATEDTEAPAAAGLGLVEQISSAYAKPLVRWLHAVRDEVSFRALGIAGDFELAGLERAYGRLGLLRRRAWYAAYDETRSVAAAVSVDIAPPGYNLTSIGNHATLYVGPDFGVGPAGARRVRALVHYAGDAFRQHGRRHFLLMAPPSLEATLRSFGLRFMAPGQEFVVGAAMFRTLNTFINEAYRGGRGDVQASAKTGHG